MCQLLHLLAAALSHSQNGILLGSTSTNLYDAGGYLNNGYGGAASAANESFKLSKNKWTTTLAPVLQGAMFPASAFYKAKLYCIGGWAAWGGPVLNDVQIYHP